MLAEFEKLLSRFIPQPTKIQSLTKLSEHASYRSYFRVHLEDQSSYIVMKLPVGVSSVSEEVTKSNQAIQELPFINVQRYLSSLSIRIPKIYGWDESLHLMLLEDLGDNLLENLLSNASAATQETWYQKAIDLLVAIQHKTALSQDQTCIAFHRHFDDFLLNWEFDHFLEYGIEDRLQLKVSPAEKKEFEKLTRPLTEAILKFPKSWVHRDFQSRNLIYHAEQLYLLDFQDALIGPSIYDLVSLLRDSYIALDWQTVERLIDYYFQQQKRISLFQLPKEECFTFFHLVTLQRKLKDTGRFQYIHTVKKNSDFLKHVPNSINHIKEAFKRLPKAQTLQQWIGRYLPEIL